MLTPFTTTDSSNWIRSRHHALIVFSFFIAPHTNLILVSNFVGMKDDTIPYVNKII